ncbi:predicted protein [Lichtheimia corymbifera JMRC:FSU:9682]|uniref:Uncharacterized protein n=1 Tax=Lichtheimia corymbifera JMRC:FSU:9682 TaxID=1263082 RepID=A0A068S3G9_9FUNG|nr:predicted protein [Lichtheimia corymbifera JMRC:FSU:9682]
MQIANPSTFAMLELMRMTLFKTMNELSLVPIIVSSLIQLKEIPLQTASKTKECLRERSRGVTPTHKPPLSWLQSRYYELDSIKKRKGNQR